MNRIFFRVFIMCIGAASPLLPMAAFAEDLPRMEEVVITAPVSARFLQSTAAETTVITAAEIKRMQVRTIPELLESISAVHLTERGTPGSQADLSMRGSSSEGAHILIKRRPGGGPADRPFPHGHSGQSRRRRAGGSALRRRLPALRLLRHRRDREHRKPARALARAGIFSSGSFGAKRAGGSLSASGERLSLTVNAEWRKSDGYMKGTDLEYAVLDGSGRWSTDAWTVRWNGGVLRKSFGAQGFYGPWPSFEKVTGVQGGINAVRTVDDRSQVRLRLGARGHGDDFTLDRYRPEYYRNTHFNRGYFIGGEYVRTHHGDGSLTMGAEAERIGITSGKLGNHRDYSAALYGECTGRFGPGEGSLSLRFDRGFRRENVLSPSAGISIPFRGVYRLRARIDRSFRSPTYTERYYDDPANRGNTDLRSERSLSIEAGLVRNLTGGILGVTFFQVRTSHALDWVRNPGETVWSAVNHGRILTSGVEGNLTARLARQWSFRGGCTLLRQEVRDRRGLESKYALNPAERTIAVTLYGPLPAGLACSLTARHERMHEGDVRTPVDVRISRQFDAVRAGIAGHNIGNERYEEIPGLRAPGRWINFELEFTR